MTIAQTLTASVYCTLSNLTLCAIHDATRSDLTLDDPVELGVSITFSDTVNNDFIQLLMPLQLHVWISFYAKPLSPGGEQKLGDVMLQTVTDVMTYQPRFCLQSGLRSAGLTADQVYQLGAIARIGDAPVPMPTILRGHVEGLRYPTAIMAPMSESEAIAPKAPSRRRTSKSLT